MVEESLLYVIALLFAVMLLVILGQKLRIAYPVFLVIGGLLISLVPGAPRTGISPDLFFLYSCRLFYMKLPGLLPGLISGKCAGRSRCMDLVW